MPTKLSIHSLSLNSLTDELVKLHLKKYNGIQIYQWIYQEFVDSFSKMSNISKNSQEILTNNFYFNQLTIVKELIDQHDGTIKFLIKLSDDQLIETVLMKFDYGYSICISSQVGCNMGCKFCASGLHKKIRNLSVDEIVLQYVEVQKYLNKKSKGRISNVVIMGIGEPFDNYANLKEALNIFNNHYGIAIGNRHITVSTSGILPYILQFGKDFPQINLAISLHAPNDSLRSQLMPINKKYDIVNLMNTVKKYLKITKQRICFEYILLKNINDIDEHAEQLAKLIKGLSCYVNLIVYNNVSENVYHPSKRFIPFMQILQNHGIITTKRLERGIKINAACGQLRIRQIEVNGKL